MGKGVKKMDNATTITSIMTSAGEVVTGAFGWVTTAVNAIISNPLILMCVLLPFVGLGITIVRRLIRTKAR